MNRLQRFAGVLIALGSCSVCLADPPVVIEKKPVLVKEPVVVKERAAHDTTRASELMGMELVLENGTSIGTIKDLVLDNTSGQVQYAIVGDKGEYRGIPWKTLSYYYGEEPKDRYFILNVDEARYQKAPAIPQKEYQTFSTWSTYAPQVTKYYSDVRPARPAAVRRAERRLDRALDR
jgi:sporulation protein YlmC with PRC-barrel domain